MLELLVAGSLWLDGDSTLHVFQSTATRIEASGTLEGREVKGLVVTIPVAGLESGEKRLDKNLRKALKAEENPAITFSLGTYELPGCAPKAETCAVKAKGKLKIAGAEKETELEAEVTFRPDGVQVKGSKGLKMTEFGVKPPSLMLGAIKVKDPVVIHWDIVLRPAKPAGSAP